jgi:dipeptidyl aminopeptidase/acylaminoacyl peptidase
MKKISLMFGILWHCSVLWVVAEVPLIPREILFGNPTYAAPQLSRDGTKIAYLAPYKNVINIWVKSIDADDACVVTADSGRGIYSFVWSHDGLALFYVQDKDGDENWHIYKVSLENGLIIDLTPFDSVKAEIIGISEYDSKMIVGLNLRVSQWFDLYCINTDTGEMVLLERNETMVVRWLLNDAMELCGKVVRTKVGFEVLVRDVQTDTWKSIIAWDCATKGSSGVICFNKDATYLYCLDACYSDTNHLVKIDCATGLVTSLHTDKGYDISDVIVHPKTYEIQGLTIYKDYKESIFFDTAFKNDVEFLKQQQPYQLSLVSRDYNDNRWIIAYTRDNAPTCFYLYDRVQRKMNFMFYSRPALLNYKLAPMHPFALRARDGLQLEGYVTYPVDSNRKGLPAVLYVHGGPWVRDVWGYDAQAQWFANRGYVCIQVNFRGSTGYGKSFVNAADKEWGNKMHHDLLDTVQYFIERGDIDPRRVAIYGESYGGYAALCGAAFSSDVFCCAVDVVGPSNLLTLLKTLPDYWEPHRQDIYTRIGHPEKDRDLLQERSPLFSVKKIGIPILIAQGAHDPRVKKAEAEQIVTALRALGLPNEYLLFPDEGHGFVKQQNRLIFYRQAETFLARYLKGMCEQEK